METWGNYTNISLDKPSLRMSTTWFLSPQWNICPTFRMCCKYNLYWVVLYQVTCPKHGPLFQKQQPHRYEKWGALVRCSLSVHIQGLLLELRLKSEWARGGGAVSSREDVKVVSDQKLWDRMCKVREDVWAYWEEICSTGEKTCGRRGDIARGHISRIPCSWRLSVPVSVRAIPLLILKSLLLLLHIFFHGPPHPLHVVFQMSFCSK